MQGAAVPGKGDRGTDLPKEGAHAMPQYFLLYLEILRQLRRPVQQPGRVCCQLRTSKWVSQLSADWTGLAENSSLSLMKGCAASSLRALNPDADTTMCALVQPFVQVAAGALSCKHFQKGHEGPDLRRG